MQAVICQVRIDAGGTITDQYREVMWVARGSSLDHQIAITAQTLMHQPVMHGTGSKQGMYWMRVLSDILIAQYQHHLAVLDSLHGLIGNIDDGGFQIDAHRIIQRDYFISVIGLFLTQRQQLHKLALRQDRGIHQQAIGMFGSFFKHVAFATETGLQ